MVSMKAVAPKGQSKAQKCNQKMPKMGKMKKDIVWTELPGGGVDFTLSRRQWYRIMTGLWIGVWAMFLLPFAIDLTLCSFELPRQTADVLRQAAGASPFSIFRDTGKTRIQRRVPSFTGIVRPRRADDGPPPYDDDGPPPYDPHDLGRDLAGPLALQLRRQARETTRPETRNDARYVLAYRVVPEHHEYADQMASCVMECDAKFGPDPGGLIGLLAARGSRSPAGGAPERREAVATNL